MKSNGKKSLSFNVSKYQKKTAKPRQELNMNKIVASESRAFSIPDQLPYLYPDKQQLNNSFLKTKPRGKFLNTKDNFQKTSKFSQ